MISKHIRYTIAAAVISIAAIIGGLFAFTTVHANPSDFPPATVCATCTSATTSGAYIAYGIGTTTVTYDSYQSGARATQTDNALLQFIFNATTTASTTNIIFARVEYSMNGVDWYPQSSQTASNATSTPMTGMAADYSFALSTTSIAISGNFPGTDSYTAGATTTILQTLALNRLPMRYTRVVFFIPAGGGKGSIWSSIQPAKERNQ